MSHFFVGFRKLRKISSEKKTIVFIILFIIVFVFYSIKNESEKSADSETCKNIYANDKELYATLANISEYEKEYSFDYNKMLKCFNLNATKFFDIPFVSAIRGERNIFQSVAEHVYSNRNIKNLEPNNVKCGDIIYVQTENIKIFFKQFHPNIVYPYILITHESDLSVGEPWHLKMLEDPKIIMWYTVNIAGQHSKLKPLPIGLIPPSRKHLTILYDLTHKLIPSYERSILLYINFRPETSKNRSAVYNYFKDTFKDIPRIFIEHIRTDWQTYLSDIGNSNFVISPPGAGLDCHRTWESMALGATPVVLNNSLLPLYDNLPVMIVNDWTDVTEESMKRFQLEQLTNFSKDGVAWKPSFWLRFWISNIMNVKRDYINQHC